MLSPPLQECLSGSQGVDSPCTQQSTNANQYQQDGELLVILNMARWTDIGMRYRSSAGLHLRAYLLGVH